MAPVPKSGMAILSGLDWIKLTMQCSKNGKSKNNRSGPSVAAGQ